MMSIAVVSIEDQTTFIVVQFFSFSFSFRQTFCQTRKPSSRMRTARLSTVPVVMAATRGQYRWGRYLEGVCLNPTPRYLSPGTYSSCLPAPCDTYPSWKGLGQEISTPLLPERITDRCPGKTLPYLNNACGRNNRLVDPLLELAFSSGKSWIRHCMMYKPHI